VCCVADLSTAMDLLLVLLTGTNSRRIIETTAMGSVWRGLRNYCIATLLIMYFQGPALCGGFLQLRYVIFYSLSLSQAGAIVRIAPESLKNHFQCDYLSGVISESIVWLVGGLVNLLRQQ